MGGDALSAGFHMRCGKLIGGPGGASDNDRSFSQASWTSVQPCRTPEQTIFSKPPLRGREPLGAVLASGRVDRGIFRVCLRELLRR
jgi:hypothetical protein